MTSNELANFAAVLTGGVTAISVVAAAITYLRAEARKRKEFMATEYHRFRDTPAVKNVMVMLDGEWGGTKLTLGGKEVCQLSYSELVNALRIHEPTMQFDPWEWEVRTSFDDFLDGLVTFAQFLRCRLVTKQDLRPYLTYWLDMICGASWVDRGSAEKLWEYIDFYGFGDVRWLAETMGHITPSRRFQRTNNQGEAGDTVDAAKRPTTEAPGSGRKS